MNAAVLWYRTVNATSKTESSHADMQHSGYIQLIVAGSLYLLGIFHTKNFLGLLYANNH
jgi:hypothetical protein